jgi:hypothetical protein
LRSSADGRLCVVGSIKIIRGSIFTRWLRGRVDPPPKKMNGLPADPDNEVHVQCLQAEHARQVFVCQSRAVSTTNSLHYATRRLYRFGDILTASNAAHQVRAAPDPAHPYADPVATAWHLCFRARSTAGQTDAEVQTPKGTDRSAISACFRKSGLGSPWQLPTHHAWKSELNDLLTGMSNVLGEPGGRSPALSFDVVLEANALLWQAVDLAAYPAARLGALLDVCAFDFQVLAFCRPGEPYLLSLYAMHKHLCVGKRADQRGCQEYVGLSWRTSEAGTKTNPTARAYNVDNHGACAVLLATTKSGFRTGEAVSEVLRFWNVGPEGPWPYPPGAWSKVAFFRSALGRWLPRELGRLPPPLPSPLPPTPATSRYGGPQRSRPQRRLGLLPQELWRNAGRRERSRKIPPQRPRTCWLFSYRPALRTWWEHTRPSFARDQACRLQHVVRPSDLRC